MICFVTHFPEFLFWVIPIVILGGIALFLLKWVVLILLFILFSIIYAVQGRWKEFNYRLDNDPTFLTFDKETGKFIW